ncbi:MAG: hypothetical protein ISR60_02800, partial [Anaerolineales bacterium]|nr:hypothetical protein [Anaerolineales bacterium]
MKRIWGLLFLFATLPLLAFNHAAEITPLTSLGRGTLSQVAWSPDGNTLAVSGSNGIYFYNAETLAELRHIEAGPLITSIAYSPDGTLLAAGSADEIFARQESWRRFSPWGSENNFVYVYDAVSGEQLAALECGDSYLTRVQFSPDGQLLAAASMYPDDNGIRVWETPTILAGETALLYRFREHTRGVFGLDFSPDGRLLLSGAGDNSARLWNLATGQLESLFMYRVSAKLIVLDVDFNPLDNGIVALAAGEYKHQIPHPVLEIWDANTSTLRINLEGHTSDVEAVVFSPNGQILASGGGTPDNDIRLWDSATGALLHTLSGHRAGVRGLAFSPDGAILASIGWDATLYLWDVENRVQLNVLETHTSSIWSAAIHPTGDWLASGGDDGLVHIWDAAGDQIATFNAATNRVTALAINPVSSEIALATDQPEVSIQIWDTDLGIQLYNLNGHTTFAQVAAYSPDGRWLATGGSLGDNTVIVWDTLSRQMVYSFPEHTRSVKSLVFGPDDILITGDGRGTIRMWDLKTGELIQPLEAHSCAINALAINPAGDVVASGGCDKNVIFWDFATGKILSNVDGFPAPITNLSFGARNQLIASDDEGQLWLLDSATGDSTSLGQSDQPEIQF